MLVFTGLKAQLLIGQPFTVPSALCIALQEKDDKGEKVFRGPRVRMGIHWAVEGTVANRSAFQFALLLFSLSASPTQRCIVLLTLP